MSELRKTCPCSSGKERRELIDARGILCAFVCDACEARKRLTFRPEVLTDANYEHDEPLNEIIDPSQTFIGEQSMNIQSGINGHECRSAVIRNLNDKFRKSFTGGTVLLSASVAALNKTRQGIIIVAVRAFDDFTADNDPHGEHDFGSLEVCDETIFWKIDYYDLGKTMHSPDAADPAVTARVLTIMLASDY